MRTNTPVHEALVELVTRSISTGVIVATIATLSLASLRLATLRHDVSDLRSCIRSPDSISEACARPILSDFMKSEKVSSIMDKLQDEFSPADCHLIGHIVGEETHLKSWETIIATCGTSCNFACVHGASLGILKEAASMQDLLQQNGRIDESEKAGAQMCKSELSCHGVGHAYLGIFGTVPQALSACSRTSEVDSIRTACYSGIYMELFASTTDMIAQERRGPTGDTDLLFPCDRSSAEYRPACYHYLYLNQNNTFERKGLRDHIEMSKERIEACRPLTQQYLRAACFGTVGRALFWPDPVSDEIAHAVCESIPLPGDKTACNEAFVNGLANFGQVSRAVDFCSSLDGIEPKKLCFNGVFWPGWKSQLYDFSTVCSLSTDPYCKLFQDTYEGTAPNSL